MRPRIPSPATLLAGLALFISLGGTSIAAVSFARNAGAVDGKSATGAKASLKRAAGKLVAADDGGRIPGKFVQGVSHATAFGSYVQVADNATGASSELAGYGKVGTLSATCTDENGTAGVLDPRTDLTFTNTSGEVINFSSRVGVGGQTIMALQPATTESLAIRGSNTFTVEVNLRDIDVRFDGTVRQDGKGTGDAKCLVYGTLTLVN